jgi:hypothetical protein
MKNMQNLFCHCQTGYCEVAMDTCFELLVRPGAAKQVPDWATSSLCSAKTSCSIIWSEP